jgi:hypothetical protein
MANIITAIGNALQPVGKDTLLPDGRLVFTPRGSANGPDPEDDAPRYITPRQRVLLGWSKLPWGLVPIFFIAFIAHNGFIGGRKKVDFTNSGDVALLIGFLTVWVLVALGFFVMFRVGSRIHNEQFYEPDA